MAPYLTSEWSNNARRVVDFAAFKRRTETPSCEHPDILLSEYPSIVSCLSIACSFEHRQMNIAWCLSNNVAVHCYSSYPQRITLIFLMQGKSYSMDRLSNFTSFAININIFLFSPLKFLNTFMHIYLHRSNTYIDFSDISFFIKPLFSLVVCTKSSNKSKTRNALTHCTSRSPINQSTPIHLPT